MWSFNGVTRHNCNFRDCFIYHYHTPTTLRSFFTIQLDKNNVKPHSVKRSRCFKMSMTWTPIRFWIYKGCSSVKRGIRPASHHMIAVDDLLARDAGVNDLAMRHSDSGMNDWCKGQWFHDNDIWINANCCLGDESLC